MRYPTAKEVVFSALCLFLVGWLNSLRKLNGAEFVALEKKSAARSTSLPEKYFPHHNPQPKEFCFTLINNGFYNLFLKFNVFELSKSHGSRMIGRQNAMIFPAGKGADSSSAAFQLCVYSEREDSNVTFNILHFEASYKEKKFGGPATSASADAFCLCPEETTNAIEDPSKRQLILERCQGYKTFFNHAIANYFCDPAAEKNNNLRGPW